MRIFAHFARFVGCLIKETSRGPDGTIYAEVENHKPLKAMSIGVPFTRKIYSVHLLSSEVITFEAVEATFETQDGIIAFHGLGMDLLYLIPLHAIKFIRVGEPTSKVGTLPRTPDYSAPELPDWMNQPAVKTPAHSLQEGSLAALVEIASRNQMSSTNGVKRPLAEVAE